MIYEKNLILKGRRKDLITKKNISTLTETRKWKLKGNVQRNHLNKCFSWQAYSFHGQNTNEKCKHFTTKTNSQTSQRPSSCIGLFSKKKCRNWLQGQGAHWSFYCGRLNQYFLRTCGTSVTNGLTNALCFVHFWGNKFFPWKLDRDHQSYGSCMWVRSYYLYQWVSRESWGLFCTRSNISEADKQANVRGHGLQCGSVC